VDQKDNIRGAGRLSLFARTLYKALWPRLRIFAHPIRLCSELLRPLRPSVWIVTGEEKGSHLPLSICLSATTDEYKSYLLELIFGSSFRARCLGRTWLWNVFKTMPKAAGGCSMVFAEVHQRHLKLLGARGGIVIPAWIFGEVDLPRGPVVMKRKSHQYVVRKIRQNHLEFEISRDPQRFDDFYHNMYVPYTKERYGDTAFLSTKEVRKAQFDNGELLLVKKLGEYISGMLIGYDGAYAQLRCLGVRDGNRNHVRDGAIAAAYEFSLRRMEEKGYRKCGLARSRAFLQDGVLRFKRNLPQTIIGASNRKLMVRVLAETHATRAFLLNNPFILERSGKLHGLVFMSSEVPPTPQALREISKQYFHAGLSKLVVHCFCPGDKGRENRIEPEFPPDLSQDTSSPRYERLSLAEATDLIKGLGCIGKTIAIAIHPDKEDRGKYN
jgi:hypothetical protein